MLFDAGHVGRDCSMFTAFSRSQTQKVGVNQDHPNFAYVQLSPATLYMYILSRDTEFCTHRVA